MSEGVGPLDPAEREALESTRRLGWTTRLGLPRALRVDQQHQWQDEPMDSDKQSWLEADGGPRRWRDLPARPRATGPLAVSVVWLACAGVA